MPACSGFFVARHCGGDLSNLDVQQGRRQAVAVVWSQVLVGAAVAATCLLGWGTRAGASALLGAGIGVAATSLMAFALLRHDENAQAMRVALSFFMGWMVKVGFTVALLVMAFQSRKWTRYRCSQRTSPRSSAIGWGRLARRAAVNVSGFGVADRKWPAKHLQAALSTSPTT